MRVSLALNAALTAAGITQLEAVAHTYPEKLADGSTDHPNKLTASITFKQTAADFAAGNTPPAAPAVKVDGATRAINAIDNDGVTGTTEEAKRPGSTADPFQHLRYTPGWRHRRVHSGRQGSVGGDFFDAEC